MVDVSSKSKTVVSEDLHFDGLSSVWRPFHNRLNPPPKSIVKSEKPSMVQESPLDARSPQEVLDYHGMYKDPSYYDKNIDKLYLDLTEFDDYETCLNNIISMREKFNRLPGEVKARFDNDPNTFFKYVGSDKFDIERVMTPEMSKKYNDFKAKEKARSDYEAYLKSPEYKAQVEQQKQFEAWSRSQFEKFQSEQLQKQNLSQ